MKVRLGFVSNSSSSSFCIYGIYLGYESDIIEMLQKKDKDVNEDNFDVWEFGKTIEKEYGLRLFGYHDDDYYIGKEVCKIKDDETGLQFKQTIQKNIEEIFEEKVKCNFHEEAWYNG